MKTIGIVIGIIVLVIVGAVGYLVMQSGDLIKNAMETLGSEYLEADVSVGSVDISFTDGAGRISQFQIGNPQGFDGPYAMRVESIELALDPSNISAEMVGIKRIGIDGAKVAAVMKGVKETNFQALLDNLERNVGPSAEEEEATDESEMKMVIDRFDFTSAEASLDSDLLGQSDLDITDIHLEGIGRKTAGVSAAEALRQIFQPITEAIVRAAVAKQAGVEDIEAEVDKQIEKANEKLEKKLGGALKDLGRP